MNEVKKDYMWQVNNETGRAVTQLRQYNSLSIEEAAQRAELEPDKLAALEAGRMPRNVHNLARIVEAMGGRLAIVPEESPDDPHCQFIEFDD